MDIKKLITESTEKIRKNYFQLPLDGKEDPIYRERVYCYELYHQLRLIWPNKSKYELSGEVDKSGHPLIRGNNLDNTKPDLIIHIPGDMNGNHTIIEVKPINARNEGIVKDLKTLTAFRRDANYRNAIYLFYGNGNIDTKLKFINQSQSSFKNEIDLSLIEIWWHENFGTPAKLKTNIA